jgi:hypothetical protein
MIAKIFLSKYSEYWCTLNFCVGWGSEPIIRFAFFKHTIYQIISHHTIFNVLRNFSSCSVVSQSLSSLHLSLSLCLCLCLSLSIPVSLCLCLSLSLSCARLNMQSRPCLLAIGRLSGISFPKLIGTRTACFCRNDVYVYCDKCCCST